MRIVATVAGTSHELAAQALEASSWQTKTACVVAANAINADEANRLLAASGGRLDVALKATSEGRLAPLRKTDSEINKG